MYGIQVRSVRYLYYTCNTSVNMCIGSAITLVLKRQICSKGIGIFRAKMGHNSNFTLAYAQFCLHKCEVKVENCTQMN